MKVYGIIPARLESTRLPRKLLLAETGKPLIVHTLENAKRAKSLEAVIVATDSAEIAAAVRSVGGRVEMTGQHSCGTDRVAEVARRLPDAELIVNIQGDEPELDPSNIDRLIWLMLDKPQADMGTLSAKLSADQVAKPSCVKLLCATDGRAVHFTRAPITYALRHVGTYAFRPGVLQEIAGRPPSGMELSERLEQLRALEAGFWVYASYVDHDEVGIDTPADYRAFVERHNASL